MSLPLIIGYHLVWTGYGWWLPNDPRGSMSHCIKCDLIAELGELHYDRKRVQPASREIRTFYERATPRLQFAQLEFTTEDVDQIASAFSREIAEKNPVKIGQPVQRWDFVKVYDGWPLHPGHNPNSPYAMALRKK
ncbi:MAG TPA: hypothetical protein VGI81_20995 [Tepidisphaeraceae bacterium]|jgi:hypothetical protein